MTPSLDYQTLALSGHLQEGRQALPTGGARRPSEGRPEALPPASGGLPEGPNPLRAEPGIVVNPDDSWFLNDGREHAQLGAIGVEMEEPEPGVLAVLDVTRREWDAVVHRLAIAGAV